MSAVADKRLAAIRAKVREERALISELNRQISADLKRELKKVSLDLKEVEGWLAPEILREPRSERQMAKWISFVEGILDRAIKQRKLVETVIKKHGLDARWYGGG